LTDWPPLPLEEWEATKATLHRWVQIVGKVRLGLAHPRNHWWHVTLYPGTRGLTTGPLPSHGNRSVELLFDFVDHRLVVASSDGRVESFALHDGLSVAEFHRRLFDLLVGLDIRVEIRPRPYDLDGPPFADDAGHASYDREYVERYAAVLRAAADVFVEFGGSFTGKTSPVHLFWHSFDLAVTRFSGRRGPEMPDADPVTAEAYSHEVVSFGFWTGDDRTIREPAFYSYTYPEPEALTEQPLPDSAWWRTGERGSLALLRYDDARSAADPRAAVLAFLDSAYQAGARTAGWDLAALGR
jgi:hypothetical protein